MDATGPLSSVSSIQYLEKNKISLEGRLILQNQEIEQLKAANKDLARQTKAALETAAKTFEQLQRLLDDCREFSNSPEYQAFLTRTDRINHSTITTETKNTGVNTIPKDTSSKYYDSPSFGNKCVIS